MAFIVQTNPPTDGANAYISVAFFRDYHAERGRDYGNTSTYPDETVKAWIILATQFLDLRFDYFGLPVDDDQSTEFPRKLLVNRRGDEVEGIPPCIQQATAEYALRARLSPLLPDPSRDETGMTVKSRSETVGPISERVEYLAYSGFRMPVYPLADRLILSQGIGCEPSSGGGGGGLSSGDLGRG